MSARRVALVTMMLAASVVAATVWPRSCTVPAWAADLSAGAEFSPEFNAYSWESPRSLDFLVARSEAIVVARSLRSDDVVRRKYRVVEVVKGDGRLRKRCVLEVEGPDEGGARSNGTDYLLFLSPHATDHKLYVGSWGWCDEFDLSRPESQVTCQDPERSALGFMSGLTNAQFVDATRREVIDPRPTLAPVYRGWGPNGTSTQSSVDD